MSANKLALIAVGTALLIASLNGADPSVFEILNYPEKAEKQLIREVRFEPSEKKLFRAYNGAVVPGKGIEKSHALRLERTDGRAKPVYAAVNLPPAVPGTDYTVEVMVKGENIRKAASARKFYCLSIESRVRATGKMANWRDGTIRIYSDIPGNDFTCLTLNFKGKKGLQPFVKLDFPSGFLGTLYFDGLKICQNGLPSTLKLTAPALRIFRSGNGRFEVAAAPAKAADPLLLAVLHRNRKILRSVIVRPDLDNVFRGDFGKGLEPGDASLLLIFADAAAKVKLAESDIDCSVESLPE